MGQATLKQQRLRRFVKSDARATVVARHGFDCCFAPLHPPPPAPSPRSLFFPLFAALAPSRHMRKQLLVHHPGVWRAQTRREKERIRVPRPIPTRTVLSVVDHRLGGVSVDSLFFFFLSFVYE